MQPSIDHDQALTLAKNVTFWLSFVGMGTNTFDPIYQQKSPPYRAAHRLMISASELRLVDGFNSDLYQALSPYIIALPQVGTTIDVNAASEAVLIAGGGYGTLRIIDKVNFSALQKNPKWFIGYSDSTIIQARLQKLKIPNIHGTMAFQFAKNVEATHSIKQLLFGEKITYSIPKNKLNRIGKTEGEIVGGNLSLIYALSGSVDDLDTKNKILFIEDLDEQLYHIDRMMLQLKRSGKLKNLKGLVVGGMTDMKDNAIPFGKTANEIILDAVREYKYPVCFDFPAGHIEKNMAIYLGKKVKLNVTKTKVELNYL